jgi:hypothetical protein
MTKVFVSHSSQDRAWVEQEVIALLNSHGIETWYSQDDIKTGAQWEREIQRALSTCDWFLIVLSRHSAHSEWVKDELHLAIGNAPERIVPVMMERCNPADFHIQLARIQHVDFCGDTRARHKLIERFGVVPQEDVLDALGGGPSDSAVPPRTARWPGPGPNVLRRPWEPRRDRRSASRRFISAVSSRLSISPTGEKNCGRRSGLSAAGRACCWWESTGPARRASAKCSLIQLIAGESFKQAAHRGDQVVDDQHVQEAHGILRRTKPRAFAGPP